MWHLHPVAQEGLHALGKREDSADGDARQPWARRRERRIEVSDGAGHGATMAGGQEDDDVAHIARGIDLEQREGAPVERMRWVKNANEASRSISLCGSLSCSRRL